jgi:hypothetical protein
MRSCGVTLVILFLALFLGCGDSGKGAPTTPKAEVAGVVTLDGQPMDEKEGEISFAAPGEAPIILPITGGKFEGKAPVGDVRVEIRAYRLGKPIMMDGKPFGDPVKENYIAEQFNDLTTLKANIAAGGTKDLKFAVQKKR